MSVCWLRSDFACVSLLLVLVLVGSEASSFAYECDLTGRASGITRLHLERRRLLGLTLLLLVVAHLALLHVAAHCTAGRHGDEWRGYAADNSRLSLQARLLVLGGSTAATAGQQAEE